MLERCGMYEYASFLLQASKQTSDNNWTNTLLSNPNAPRKSTDLAWKQKKTPLCNVQNTKTLLIVFFRSFSHCCSFFCGVWHRSTLFFHLTNNLFSIIRIIFPRAYIFWPFFSPKSNSRQMHTSKSKRITMKKNVHIFIIINYSIIKSKWLEWRYPNGNCIQRSTEYYSADTDAKRSEEAVASEHHMCIIVATHCHPSRTWKNIWKCNASERKRNAAIETVSEIRREKKSSNCRSHHTNERAKKTLFK